jgi:membrane protein DedA with SNARE-associated domain
VRLYIAIFAATLGTLFVPVPEEATLLAAGFAARLGRVSLVGAVTAAWAAVLLGDLVSYLVGRALLARLLCTRLGQKLVPEPWRLWGERLVVGHGVRAILVARFLVGLRGFVYIAVGASRYPLGRFLALDAAAGVVEVGGLVLVGFAFGELRARTGAWVDLVAAAIMLAGLFGPLIARKLADLAQSARSSEARERTETQTPARSSEARERTETQTPARSSEAKERAETERTGTLERSE